jgi:hypothetical protein
MLSNLSSEQEELLLITMRDIYKGSNLQEQRQLRESLASDERLMKAFKQMLKKLLNKHSYS